MSLIWRAWPNWRNPRNHHARTGGDKVLSGNAKHDAESREIGTGYWPSGRTSSAHGNHERFYRTGWRGDGLVCNHNPSTRFQPMASAERGVAREEAGRSSKTMRAISNRIRRLE